MNFLAKFFLGIIIKVIFFFSSLRALANGNTGNTSGWSGVIPNPLCADPTDPSCDLFIVVGRIAEFLFNVGIPIAVVMYIWAGILYLTAGGDEKKLETAKKAIIWTTVGVAVILIANFLDNIIIDILTVT